MTNCKNCGAPLNGTGKCEYCGSFFPEHQNIVKVTGLPKKEDMVEIINERFRNGGSFRELVMLHERWNP